MRYVINAGTEDGPLWLMKGARGWTDNYRSSLLATFRSEIAARIVAAGMDAEESGWITGGYNGGRTKAGVRLRYRDIL